MGGLVVRFSQIVQDAQHFTLLQVERKPEQRRHGLPPLHHEEVVDVAIVNLAHELPPRLLP